MARTLFMLEGGVVSIPLISMTGCPSLSTHTPQAPLVLSCPGSFPDGVAKERLRERGAIKARGDPSRTSPTREAQYAPGWLASGTEAVECAIEG
jgi:hypothetical protein